MSGSNFVVPARSWDNIASLTDNLRGQLGVDDEPYFQVMDVMERVLDHKLGLIHFEVSSEEDMDGAEGYTCPLGAFITLREDVYVLAINGEGRARFTAAHELEHLAMHTNIPLARARPEQNVKPFRLSEQQANQFAAEILMPRQFYQIGDDEHAIMRRHGVSYEAASNRVRFLRGKLGS